MFCPICRVEYQQGFSKCSDCGVELVATQPPEPPESELESVDFKEVLTTVNSMDIAFIKSILDAEKIMYFFQGENFLRMEPLGIPARLMVRADQVEQAREILQDLKLTSCGTNVGKDLDHNP